MGNPNLVYKRADLVFHATQMIPCCLNSSGHVSNLVVVCHVVEVSNLSYLVVLCNGLYDAISITIMQIRSILSEITV